MIKLLENSLFGNRDGRRKKKGSAVVEREKLNWTETWGNEDCGRLGTSNELSVVAAGAAISDGQ